MLSIKRKMKISALVLSLLLATNLFSQDFEDLNKTTQEILQKAYKMLEESKNIIKSYTNPKQKAIPETTKGFLLYYKVVENRAKVEKRNDFLISSQIKYQIALQKDISLDDILIKSNSGIVELYGRVDSKEKADKIIDIVLKTRGVKKVVSYLIILEPKKLFL